MTVKVAEELLSFLSHCGHVLLQKTEVCVLDMLFDPFILLIPNYSPQWR